MQGKGYDLLVVVPTERLLLRIRRDFSPKDAAEVIGWLDGLRDTFGHPYSERIQAALVLTASGDLRQFVAGARQRRIDWRDVLVSACLADEDWRERLDAELSPGALTR